MALQSLAAGEMETFFPERAAQIRALRDLKHTSEEVKHLREKRRDARSSTGGSEHAPEPIENDAEARGTPPPDDVPSSSGRTGTGSDQGEAQATDAAADGSKTSGRSERELRDEQPAVTFRPSPADTPQSLQPVLKAFADWLEMQQRRVGGPIVQKAYAKEHENGRVAVYLVTSSIFRRQKYGLRFQLAEGMWKFWGFRCQAKGVVSHPRNAYLVLLDDQHEVIGGSEPQQANNIWVAKPDGQAP